jgi:2-amino-4-hydroxy-6-hydroxymethyldihydropteridine diphosphokinase
VSARLPSPPSRPTGHASGPALAFVGLGGNLEDVPATFAEARRALAALSPTPLRSSGLFSSEPWGDAPGPAYVNQVVALTFAGTPTELLADLLSIEARFGRVRSSTRFAPRPLDLDLLTFGDHRCETPELTLPHPRLHLRRFVLLPWSELAPETIPPGLGRSIRVLLAECPDRGRVSPLSV